MGACAWRAPFQGQGAKGDTVGHQVPSGATVHRFNSSRFMLWPTYRITVLALLVSFGLLPASSETLLHVWIDEVRNLVLFAPVDKKLNFKKYMVHELQFAFAPGETALLERAINASNKFILSGRTKTRVIEPKGYKMLHKHDYLYTSREVRHFALISKKLSELQPSFSDGHSIN